MSVRHSLLSKGCGVGLMLAYIMWGSFAVQAELLLRYDFTGQDTNSLAVVNEGGSGPDALKDAEVLKQLIRFGEDT